MKIGVLTSSRADFGIYKPLLRKLVKDPRFSVEIIAFGMHLQSNQGNTIEMIISEGYKVVHRIGSMPTGDEINDIVIGYGELISDFSAFWNSNTYDLVFCLGDRWEMSAAVQSGIFFEVAFAHFCGGETTLGAIDNVFRHQISLASQFHFTTAKQFSQRVIEVVGTGDKVFSVGSISVENLSNETLPDWYAVKDKFNIPFDKFILVTIHPESVGASRNKLLAKCAFNVLESILKKYCLLITKSNSDAMGSLFNEAFQILERKNPTKVKVVSALGRENYFSAIKQSEFLIGNSSSGLVEAASFKKWVINIGDRQKGRFRNNNVIDSIFEEQEILNAVKLVENSADFNGINLFERKNTTEEVINILADYAGL